MTNITLTMQADTAPELIASILSLAGNVGSTVPVPVSIDVTLPKPEKKQPGKKETEPPQTTDTTAAAEATTTTETTAETKIGIEQIRQVALKLRDSGKREALAGLLKEFGVDRATNLSNDQYPAFLEKASAL